MIPTLPFNSQCQPRKERHAEKTEGEINPIGGAAGEKALGEFFETNQQGEDQTNSQHEQFRVQMRTRLQKGQIQQQGHDPV